MSAKHAATLLTSRRFLPLFLAQITVAFNDQFFKMALITMVTWGGLNFMGMEPEVIVPLAGSIFTGPFFLFSALAGQVADKYDKALVLLRVKQAEIIIMIMAAIGFYFELPGFLLVTLALMGAQSAFFSPTRNAVLPQWLTDKELVSGNALMNGFVSVAILIGQVSGVFLILKSGGPKLVAVILVVLAIIGWLAIRKAPPAPASSSDVKINPNILGEIVNTLVFAMKHPRVFKPMLGTAWYYWLSAAVLILMPAYIKQVLHYSNIVLIVVLVLFTLGALTGAMTCLMASKGREAVMISAVGITGVAMSTLDVFIMGGDTTRLAFEGFIAASGDSKEVLGGVSDFFAMPNSKRFMFDLVLAAFSASLFVIPLNAMAQRRADPLHRARLLAAGALLLNAATTLSQMLVAGFGKMSIPMHMTFLLIAAISAAIAIYTFYRAKVLKQEVI
jgi:MFS family permease